jgi:hypothetical protein
MSKLAHPARPCRECPWKRDVAVGHFPPERFAALANTAYDMSMHVFQCHDTPDDKPAACAGFLIAGARHNLAIRLALSNGNINPDKISDGSFELFQNFREMAVANGVDPSDPVLEQCRDD